MAFTRLSTTWLRGWGFRERPSSLRRVRVGAVALTRVPVYAGDRFGDAGSVRAAGIERARCRGSARQVRSARVTALATSRSSWLLAQDDYCATLAIALSSRPPLVFGRVSLRRGQAFPYARKARTRRAASHGALQAAMAAANRV